MSFSAIADLCEKVAATTKRSLMINIVAEFIKELGEDELEPAVSMILGRSFPGGDQRELDVSWATLMNVINRLVGVDSQKFSKVFKGEGEGDVGTAIQIILETSKVRRQATLFEKPLAILEVRRIFEAIAESSGQGSREKKERLVETLLGRSTPLEAKYIIKIMIGEMRTGFQEGLMEDAVSKAFGIPLRLIHAATLISGDIGEVASICKRECMAGILKLRFKIFKPVKLMLAQATDHVEEAIGEHGGRTAFEYKLDGARIQIHKQGNEVRIFSRRLTDVTESFPDILELIQEHIKAHECILEGEVVAMGEVNHPLPFQHLMRRFRRVYNIEEMVRQIPVRLYLFDILYVNGESLIDQPYVKRRERLREVAEEIRLTDQIITGDPVQAELFLKKATDEGHEGLVAKRLDSVYTPGVRGKNWFKIKETMEPLDLVIIAAEYGYGRRYGWLSDYYLAARDDKTGEFLTVGKTFKGLTDQEIIDMTRRLKETSVGEEANTVFVLPKIVVEVAYNEIQESPKYKCSMALRFARITRVREDKSPEEADTIQKVRRIFEKQFEKKAKYY